MKKIQFIAILLLVFSMLRLQAQDAITATGGNASGLGGTVSYSVGQIVYSTHSNLNGSVSQGVQQPYEISVVTSIKEALNITLQCLVYPNPTTDFLTLKVEEYDIQQFSYKLFDINGKLIKNKTVESNETLIEMRNLVPSSYFLKIFDNQKEIKTFKIIKN